MRTILIIDRSVDGLVTGDHPPYYINENGEKITPSQTAVVDYVRRDPMNVLALQCEIAEMKDRLRKLATKK